MLHMYIVSGPPACGKSSWIKERIKRDGGIHISRDTIRFSMLSEDDEYFAKEYEVIADFLHQIQEQLDLKEQDIYVDATNLNKYSRAKLYNNLNVNNEYTVVYVGFTTPLSICLERNKNRTGREFVPESVIRRMWYQRDEVYEDMNDNDFIVFEVNLEGDITHVHSKV